MKIPFLKQYPWLGTLLEWLIKIIIFGLLTWAIYRKVYVDKSITEIKVSILQSMQAHQLLLAVVGLLMIVNWALETAKWRLLLMKVEVLKPLIAFMAVLSGVTFTMFTPNRMGEYGGRFLFLKEPLRPAAFQATILGSVAQMIATLLFGIVGVAIYNSSQGVSDLSHKLFGLMWLVILIPLLLGIYFKADEILAHLPEKWTARWKKKLVWIHYTNKELRLALVLAASRYMVYTFQYLLLLQVFTDAPAITWYNASGISLIFLIQTIIPSIALFDLGTRGLASVAILGDTINNQALVAAAFTLWFINLVIPAVAGFVIILGRKIFRKEPEYA